MRFRVAADIGLVPVTEYETVLIETPATRATSEMVAMSPLAVAITRHFRHNLKNAQNRILESIRLWYASRGLFGTSAQKTFVEIALGCALTLQTFCMLLNCLNFGVKGNLNANSSRCYSRRHSDAHR